MTNETDVKKETMTETLVRIRGIWKKEGPKGFERYEKRRSSGTLSDEELMVLLEVAARTGNAQAFVFGVVELQNRYAALKDASTWG